MKVRHVQTLDASQSPPILKGCIIHMPYNIYNNYEKSNTTVSVSQNAEASVTIVSDKTYVQTTEILSSSKADDAASRF
jgi:hypothetical protein